MAEAGATGRVAVVGVGYWGRNLARNFAELGALAAIVDPNEAAAADAAARTGAPIRSLGDVLADPAIEGVVVATRAETHFAIAKAALEAGKHVFVEKPLVLDEGEADALIALAEGAGRVLMVGHLLHYHPVFRRMLEMVRSQEYGRLRYIYSDRLNLGKIRVEEDVLWSFAPHDISMVLALAGEEPRQVSAQGAAFVTPPISDIASVQLKFPSGVRAAIRASWFHFEKVQQLVAICDHAAIVFEDSQPEWGRKLAVHEHLVETENGIPVPRRGQIRYVEIPAAEPLRLECAHFLSCMAGQSRALTDGREGRAVLRVLQRATDAMVAAETEGQAN